MSFFVGGRGWQTTPSRPISLLRPAVSRLHFRLHGFFEITGMTDVGATPEQSDKCRRTHNVRHSRQEDHLGHDQAAVDVDSLASDIVGVFGGQERHEASDIFRLAGALHRDSFNPFRHQLAFAVLAE